MDQDDPDDAVHDKLHEPEVVTTDDDEHQQAEQQPEDYHEDEESNPDQHSDDELQQTIEEIEHDFSNNILPAGEEALEPEVETVEDEEEDNGKSRDEQERPRRETREPERWTYSNVQRSYAQVVKDGKKITETQEYDAFDAQILGMLMKLFLRRMLTLKIITTNL